MPKKFDLASLGKKLAKKSQKRLIISGGLIELYEYSHPYLYNLGPSSAKPQQPRSANASLEEKREDHISRARKKIRRLIEANVRKNPIFITYTFAKNIKTLEEANPLLSKHLKELQRRYGKLKYLCVPEFQKRGAVHYHIIYFNLPYIENIKIKFAKIWPHGFIQIKAIRKIKSIAAYVSKYLQKSIEDKRTAKRKSYFCSKGLIQPVEIRDEENIDNYLEKNILDFEAVETFARPVGTVIYKRLRKQLCSQVL